MNIIITINIFKKYIIATNNQQLRNYSSSHKLKKEFDLQELYYF